MIQVELTFDATAHAYTAGCPFEPARHRLLTHCWWLAAFKRYAKRNGVACAADLDLYYHNIRGVYVLFYWIIKPRCGRGPGLMRELEVMAGHPDRLEWQGQRPRPPRFDFVLHSLQPAVAVARAGMKAILSRQQDERSERQDADASRLDMAKHWERKGETVLARALRSGAVPWAGPRAAGNAEDLIDMAHDPNKVSVVKE